MPAERDAKTEPPTPRRRREAREGGNVARSQDLPAALLLLLGLIAIDFLGPGIWQRLQAIMQTTLYETAFSKPDQLIPFAVKVVWEGLKAVAPLLLLFTLIIVVATFAQVGWLFTLKPITPSLSKINPLNGAKRLVSGQMLAKAFINVGKLALVGAVAYWTLTGAAAEMIYSFTLSFTDAVALGGALTMRLGIRLGAVLVILGLLDFAYQKYRHERDLKMTKEEVKDEYRSMEGDPQIKRRRRQLQFQLSMQRLKSDMRGADVVVTNPTHLAIALAYDPDTMQAPKVVAKGADYLAQRIRALALEYGVPIVQRKTLARALYEVVEVGAYVPERFYQAIAEILAYVYELSGRSAELREPVAAGAGR